MDNRDLAEELADLFINTVLEGTNGTTIEDAWLEWEPEWQEELREDLVERIEVELDERLDQ